MSIIFFSPFLISGDFPAEIAGIFSRCSCTKTFYETLPISGIMAAKKPPGSNQPQ